MSQQNPQQPGWGAPPQGPGWDAPPAPKKKSSFGKILGFGCLGIVALFVIVTVIAAALGGGDSSDSSNKDKAVAAEAKKPTKETVAEKSQAAQFKDCVAKSGTATEKTAVKHVTKVTGVDKSNDIMDAAEVFTDYSGGLLGEHGSDGKLIASAFASCYESKNGLVTVYDKDGEILSNGNY
ncbi:hypothetical protein GCM10023084_02400 [Streptomyces lacrimifluminis]|uniref:Uncharacterized protein n=1 Tax=Streptomyces lacrimifluminis TaxID=1500077 RepID=A0A917KRU9_9ACTN|nr:hypothetical protein [Streptomyces lacrimifluminis]GGJ21499.1 hypothetical protein GCM10012282_17480 [Streptomyces lacrimifluminis]